MVPFSLFLQYKGMLTEDRIEQVVGLDMNYMDGADQEAKEETHKDLKNYRKEVKTIRKRREQETKSMNESAIGSSDYGESNASDV